MFKKDKNTLKAPKQSSEEGQSSSVSPRRILTSSSKGATLKLAKRIQLNLEECSNIIRAGQDDGVSVRGRRKKRKQTKSRG